MTSNVKEVTDFLSSERRQADSGRSADGSISYNSVASARRRNQYR